MFFLSICLIIYTCGMSAAAAGRSARALVHTADTHRRKGSPTWNPTALGLTGSLTSGFLLQQVACPGQARGQAGRGREDGEDGCHPPKPGGCVGSVMVMTQQRGWVLSISTLCHKSFHQPGKKYTDYLRIVGIILHTMSKSLSKISYKWWFLS